MSEEVPVKTGHVVDTGDMTQVAFAPGSIFEAFKLWLGQMGLELTPPMRFSEDAHETPTRFVILSDKTVKAIWADSVAAQEVSKLGQEEA